MIRKLKYAIICIVALLCSCDFDHLYYETSFTALIHVEIDWETLSHVTPNGVTAYVFDSNGDKYLSTVSSDPDNVYLKLPAGEYTIVFHNNRIDELDGVELMGEDHLNTFSIHASQSSSQPEFDTLDEEMFVNEPDDVVSYTLRNVVIESQDIEYHYTKPELSDYEQNISKTYFIQPDHIVHVTRIIAYLDGAEYSSSKQPKAVLHGMSGGYYFDAECTSEEDVMEEFNVNLSSRVSASLSSNSTTVTSRSNGALDILDPDDEDGYSDSEINGLGMAYVDCNTFGMHITDPENQDYFLYMRFYLYDGTYTDYEVNITDYIKVEDTGTNNLHTVELILSDLPDGGGEPGDGSWGTDADADDNTGSTDVFNPSTNEWVDVGVDMTM